jgi:hypothetical protein
MKTTVFGLDLRADRALSFLERASARPTGRRLDLSLSAGVGELDWPEGAELVSDQRRPDGRLGFRIERDRTGAYRIGGPAYGSSVIAADGSHLHGAPGEGGIDEWQRLLIAQALPFAAVLQGLEVLHASAVAIDGKAVVLCGDSGSGKTSLALALCRDGAAFLTDDVLAVERVEGELIAHPGAPVVAVDRGAGDGGRGLAAGDGAVLALNDRERVERIAARSSPAGVDSLFLLERRSDGPATPRFAPVADPRRLLAATFNLVIAMPSRLAELLHVCSLLARGHAEQVTFGPAVGAIELSAAVERRISAIR